MATPRRHGHRWSNAPTPLSRGGDPTALRGELTPIGEEPSRATVIPVRAMDAWIRTLPPKRVTHLALSGEVKYDHSLLVGQKLQIPVVARVPDNYVWIITDVFYYATVPPDGLVGPPQDLPPGALVGILKWALLFGDNEPLQTQSQRMSPYAPGPAQTTSGWPWMNTPFGPQRMPAFALHATGNEEIRVEITVEDLPQFPIIRLGANLHGFTVAASRFPTAWM